MEESSCGGVTQQVMQRQAMVGVVRQQRQSADFLARRRESKTRKATKNVTCARIKGALIGEDRQKGCSCSCSSSALGGSVTRRVMGTFDCAVELT